MNNIYYRTGNTDCGFNFVFMLCLVHLEYCIKNNIKIYLDVTNFGHSDANQNWWDLIFDQPFGLEKDQCLEFEQIYGPELIEKTSKGTINGHPFSEIIDHIHDCREDFEHICFHRNTIEKYCKVKPEILKIVDDFLLPYSGKKILGLHRRGRDHFTTGHGSGQNHLLSNEYLKTIIDQYIDDYDYLYVNSDEYVYYNYLKEIYKSKIIFFNDKEEYGNEYNGLHHLPVNYTKLLKELVVEILILSKCDKLLLMMSGISHMSLLFSKTHDYILYDNHVTYH